jgi:two-component system chemotaxis response regulator CheY
MPKRIEGGSMSVRVLVADDARFMREMIKEIIQQAGYEVIGEASNGKEVVEKFHELKPDVTTMDIVMPLQSGIEAVREIKKESKDAKVIMISALGQDSLVIEALDAGAKDFIVKPFKTDKVLEVMKRVTTAA